ncbi:MAG: GNAT family N-acetyltransferase [Chloroflexi bacterium]|nr:GNAT family N-acetyltransferase [Chloroflexota bacterium]
MLTIRILDTPEEMEQVENLQRLVWPGSETDVVPSHLLITVAHNGGVVLGAYEDEKLVGMLFGFTGLYHTPDGPRPKHCSHQMGVHPASRDAGIGFALKRAQWQVVRKQGLDRITWTYDPLLSRNGHLNIGRLGAVCNTYFRQVYGDMRDGLNIGLPSDRFQVDWWVNTRRVEGCLGTQPRPSLKLADLEAAEAQNLYPVEIIDDLVRPYMVMSPPAKNLLFAEIPVDFLNLKSVDFELAQTWRIFTREVFETCFSAGYLVTDFVYDTSGNRPRSFYVLTHGEATL